MGRVGKKYRKAQEAVGDRPQYPLTEAVDVVARNAFAKFDETVEVALRLGVNPKHADQMVRGTVALPAGTGKDVRVAVFAEGDEAQAEGTIYVGGMYCAACSWLIETSMARVAGIESADINPVTHRLRVRWLRDKVGLGGILATLANLGYDPQPLAPESAARPELLEQRPGAGVSVRLEDRDRSCPEALARRRQRRHDLGAFTRDHLLHRPLAELVT